MCTWKKNVYYMAIGLNVLEYVFVQVDNSVSQVSVILLIFYLLVLSIIERWMLKSSTIIMDFPVAFFSSVSFASYIINFVRCMPALLEVLHILMSWPLHHYVTFVFNHLNGASSGITIAPPCVFWFCCCLAYHFLAF